MASAKEVVRFYTISRKFPRMIGRLHDGTKLWGGPYTTTQFAVMGLVGAAAFSTKSVWGTGMGIVDVILTVVIAWLVGFLAGMLPIGARNPLILGIGLMNRVASSSAGKWDGDRRPSVRPHVVMGSRAVKNSGAPPGIRQAPEAVMPSEPASQPHHPVISAQPTPAGTAVTAIERLLAQTGSN
jgi:hypothetical protein